MCAPGVEYDHACIQRQPNTAPMTRSIRSEIVRQAVARQGTHLFRVDVPIRVQRAVVARFSPPAPAGVRVRRVGSGAVRGEWLLPARVDSTNSTVLYLHGGGYCLGSARTHRALAGQIGLAARANVFTLDYRLAPEHPYPAALDDALAAYAWLRTSGCAQVAVAGDSAGAGLALALAVVLRARDLLPAALVALSPWTDLACTGESLRSRAAVDPLLKPDYVRRMARAYLGTTDPHTAGASPLYAPLHGLPPTLIQVGDDEVLRDDAVRLAERMTLAGSPATLDIWPGMWHVWQLYAAYMPEGQRAIDQIGAFLQQHLHGRGPS